MVPFGIKAFSDPPLNMFVKENYFASRGEYYKQLKDSSVSPFISEIVMGSVDLKPKLRKKYVVR